MHICDRSIGPNPLGSTNQSPENGWMPSGGGLTRGRSLHLTHSWFLTSTVDPGLQRRKKTGATCQHLTHPDHAPPPPPPALPARHDHGTPSIIDVVKCDELPHKEQQRERVCAFNAFFFFVLTHSDTKRVVLCTFCGHNKDPVVQVHVMTY